MNACFACDIKFYVHKIKERIIHAVNKRPNHRTMCDDYLKFALKDK